jgi:hypothetical protein
MRTRFVVDFPNINFRRRKPTQGICYISRPYAPRGPVTQLYNVALLMLCDSHRDVLRLIRFEGCLVVFVAAHPEPDRLILAPEAVVTTAAAQSCADRESLKCQRSLDAEGQGRPPEGPSHSPARPAAATDFDVAPKEITGH